MPCPKTYHKVDTRISKKNNFHVSEQPCSRNAELSHQILGHVEPYTHMNTHKTLSGPTDPRMRKHQDVIGAYQARQLRGLQEHQHRPRLRGHHPGTHFRNRLSKSCIKNNLREIQKRADAWRLPWHTLLKSMCTHAHFLHVFRTPYFDQRMGGVDPTRGNP